MKRLLIIDDFFGREVPRGRNMERVSLCRRLGLVEFGSKFKKSQEQAGPLGMVQFFRGQTPLKAKVGDVVENDLAGCLSLAGRCAPDGESWDLLLLDLCFYTGEVTDASDEDFAGFPEGRPEDDDPDCFFGLKILEAIRDRFPELPVLIFSAHSGDKVGARVKDLGALRLIARDDPNARLVLAEVLTELDKPPATMSASPRDCSALLALARALPAPTVPELKSALPVLKQMEAVLLLRTLRGALARHRDEQGVILLPALKLLTGRENLTTSQAADCVKRLVHQTRPYEAVLLADPLIKDAYEKSSRLRPGAGKHD